MKLQREKSQSVTLQLSSRTEVQIESHAQEENETVLLLRRTARSDGIDAVSHSWHDDTRGSERKWRVYGRNVKDI